MSDTTGNRGDLMLVGRTVAGVELLGRSGAEAFELAYDDDHKPRVDWWAGANWRGHRVFSEKYPYGAQAVEDLLGRVLNGGLCTRCERITVLGIVTPQPKRSKLRPPDKVGYCTFILHATDLDDPNTYRYVRDCEGTP